MIHIVNNGSKMDEDVMNKVLISTLVDGCFEINSGEKLVFEELWITIDDAKEDEPELRCQVDLYLGKKRKNYSNYVARGRSKRKFYETKDELRAEAYYELFQWIFNQGVKHLIEKQKKHDIPYITDK